MLRERALLTQEQLAHRAGISARTVRDLELGKVARPRSGTIDLLADALRLPERERRAIAALARGAAVELLPNEQSRPSQLPPDQADYIGRTEQLRRLDALLTMDEPDPSAPTAIAVIVGAAGIGKTALAIHWAHRVRRRFTDGELYLNLHGYAAAAPRTTMECLFQLLTSLGVAADRIPSDVDAAAALYRSRLAGKCMLIVLDDARDAEQVRPLLAGGPGCVVLVTSRQRLAGLAASHCVHRFALEALTARESVALILRIAGEQRVSAEKRAVAHLARLCGHLPLALRIAAANLASRPHQSISAYVTKLEASDRLGALTVDGDAQAAVGTAFEPSYTALAPDIRGLFRSLGAFPGRDFVAPLAGVLAGVTTESAARLLDRLAAAHLIIEYQPDRYIFHDLIRLYAAQRAATEDTAEERQVIAGRLYAWYLATIGAAGRVLYPHLLRVEVPEDALALRFDDPSAALAWLVAELPNLTAVISHTANHGPAQTSWLMADTLRGYFWLRRDTISWLTIAHAGLAAAELAGDLKAQAACHQSIAQAHHCAGRYQKAIDHNQSAVAFCQQSGWQEVQATALSHLGSAHLGLGQLEQATDNYQQSLEINHQIGRRVGVATALANLGIVHARLGRLQQAASNFMEALTLQREVSGIGAQAVTLGNLGVAHRELGHLDVAFGYLVESLALARQVGGMDTEASALVALATVHADAGRLDLAFECSASALAVIQHTDDRRMHTETLNTHGMVQSRLGRHQEALVLHARALHVARVIGSRSAVATALIGMALTHQGMGRNPLALLRARRALAVASTARYRVLEGHAHGALAEAYLGNGDRQQAIVHAQRALTIHEECGHQPGIARSRGILANVAALR